MNKDNDILQIIKEISEIDYCIENHELSFSEDLNFDSLDTVVLLSRLNEELELNVDDNDVKDIKKIKELLLYFKK